MVAAIVRLSIPVFGHAPQDLEGGRRGGPESSGHA
jgi:hypothetical protein